MESNPLHQNQPAGNLNTILELWDKLLRVKTVSFVAKAKSENGYKWKREGLGDVITTMKGSDCVLFEERGVWKGSDSGKTCFTNRFRWTLDSSSGQISLEHLRRGEKHPVFLFHLIPISQSELCTKKPHLCGQDTYQGKVNFNKDLIRLTWQVIGPKKNEEIVSFYR